MYVLFYLFITDSCFSHGSLVSHGQFKESHQQLLFNVQKKKEGDRKGGGDGEGEGEGKEKKNPRKQNIQNLGLKGNLSVAKSLVEGVIYLEGKYSEKFFREQFLKLESTEF